MGIKTVGTQEDWGRGRACALLSDLERHRPDLTPQIQAIQNRLLPPQDLILKDAEFRDSLLSAPQVTRSHAALAPLQGVLMDGLQPMNS